MNQLLRDRRCVFVRDSDRAPTLFYLFRTRDCKTSFFSEIDQVFRLSHALLADLVDADLIDDLVTGLRCVERGNRGRAVQESRDVWRVAQRRVESEWRLVGHPTRRLRLEFVLQIRSDVQVTRAWTTAEPFHRSAGSEISIQVFHAERHSAC